MTPSNGGDFSGDATFDPRTRQTASGHSQVVCVWCEPHHRVGVVECRPENDGLVTHGMCREAFNREMAKINPSSSEFV